MVNEVDERAPAAVVTAGSVMIRFAGLDRQQLTINSQ
jgi:hypothetical protein